MTVTALAETPGGAAPDAIERQIDDPPHRRVGMVGTGSPKGGRVAGGIVSSGTVVGRSRQLAEALMLRIRRYG
jgi:hypothetical protein